MYDYNTAISEIQRLTRLTADADDDFQRCALYGGIASLIDRLMDVPAEQDAYLAEKLINLRTHVGCALGFDSSGHEIEQHVTWAIGDADVAARIMSERAT